MTPFLSEDFLLQSEAAKILYHRYAEKEPIFDFHNHLLPQEIYANRTLGNLANAWLDHDHYKWRAMRAADVDERLITGHLRKDGSVKSDEERGGAAAVASADWERYLAFVRTLQLCPGNPLYHWSHLELKRYFGINEPITEKNAREIWDQCNALLSQKEYFPRGLLQKQNVKALCTTDDPADSLEWHKKIADEQESGGAAVFDVKVRPSFRPDNAVCAENPGFADYVARLQNVTGTKITDIEALIAALETRIAFFKENGCLVSDHSLEDDFFAPATQAQADAVFKKALTASTDGAPKNGLTKTEIAQYKTYLLTRLGRLYARNNMAMQIHIGALRDNNTRLFRERGKNIGVDSLQDFNYAAQIGSLLDAIYAGSAQDGSEPKIILYNLNPKDNEALATMAANFRNCQFGPAWWFNDHKDGIEQQIRVYARTAALGRYVGMLTDSRSFLSYPRHEYFRRILCNFVGNLVENGEFPWDEQLLGTLVRNICYQNSTEFFGL